MKRNKMRYTLISILLSFATLTMAKDNVVLSPNGQLKTIVKCEDGKLKYEVLLNDKQIVRNSALGLYTNLTDFTRRLQVTDIETNIVEKKGKMSRTKQSTVNYHANTLTLTCQNTDSMVLKVEFQVSDNNVAFRYLIPQQK
ncbi:MAG: glycoside hydrolase family 97 N-terminal domain-containing protein, partial [Prevotella sp.]|nr:glycoside hydrolase family 97 N-terminal domain-containing protein [Prevotella sp.]